MFTNKNNYGWSGNDLVSRVLLFYARNVPNHRGKWRIFRFFATKLCPYGVSLINRNGAKIRVDPNDYIGQCICFDGAFEPLSLQLAAKLMENGGNFLDVGANIGLYTCSLSSNTGVRCIAVEASAIAFVKLYHNLRLNNSERVTAVNTAVGMGYDIVNLETPNHLNLGTTRVSDSATAIRQSIHSVTMMPLSDVLRKFLPNSSIQLMKIDVEGYELNVFRGLDFSSEHRPKNIIMEYLNPAEVDPIKLNGCFDLLVSFGYKPYTIEGKPFSRGMEIPEENLWWVDQSEN
jgi:FkbM family methyltransferase